ncbi:MAG: hypothetical protein WBC44_05630, partial [Planctomycetaceae bacterium]
ASSGEPAVLGGTPIVREGWPGWPIVEEHEQQAPGAMLSRRCPLTSLVVVASSAAGEHADGKETVGNMLTCRR